MTALAGWVGSTRNGDPETACRLMLQAQRRYGLLPERMVADGNACFGLLSFPTSSETSADDRPVLVGDELLVADIRVDNREELATSIGLSSAELRKSSDLELLERAWRRLGSACLDRVVGDFALAAFDRSTGRLLLARDLSGQRPLFYWREGSRMAFASMPGGLIALPQVWNGFDFHQAARQLSGEVSSRPPTMFKGVFRVPPGKRIILGPNGDIQEEWVWRPSFRELRLRHEQDYVEAYREVLDTAVRSRLRRSGGRVAAQLSAGFDSNAVTATAARLLPAEERLLAYTAAPREGFVGPDEADWPSDESELASLTARLHRLEHHIVRTSAEPLAHVREQAGTYLDPFRNVLNAGWDLAIRKDAACRGAKVLLVGDLGNLTLNGGGIYALADMFRRGQFGEWFRELRLAHAKGSWRWRFLFHASLQPCLPDVAQRSVARLRAREDLSRSGFVRREWLERLYGPSGSRPPDPLTGAPGLQRLKSLARLDSGTMRKGALAESGIEVRDPMGDRRVIEFALSLPPEQLLRGGEPWPLVRKALADRVPAELLKRRVRGFQSADWPVSLDPASLGNMLDEIEASPAACELIDFARLRTALQNWPKLSEAGGGRMVGLYASTLPMTIAAGYVLLEAERIAGSSGKDLACASTRSDSAPS